MSNEVISEINNRTQHMNQLQAEYNKEYSDFHKKMELKQVVINGVHAKLVELVEMIADEGKLIEYFEGLKDSHYGEIPDKPRAYYNGPDMAIIDILKSDEAEVFLRDPNAWLEKNTMRAHRPPIQFNKEGFC